MGIQLPRLFPTWTFPFSTTRPQALHTIFARPILFLNQTLSFVIAIDNAWVSVYTNKQLVAEGEVNMNL